MLAPVFGAEQRRGHADIEAVDQAGTGDGQAGAGGGQRRVTHAALFLTEDIGGAAGQAGAVEVAAVAGGGGIDGKACRLKRLNGGDQIVGG